jgi:hypothetical protein
MTVSLVLIVAGFILLAIVLASFMLPGSSNATRSDRHNEVGTGGGDGGPR